MTTKLSAVFIASLTLIFLTACGDKETAMPADKAPATEAAAVEAPAALTRSASPEGARVFFISPADGATVSSPVTIEFGIEGMNVVAAGVSEPDSGHHHLLVDTELPPLDMPIPADANHIHFGDGSTSTELALDPGQHSLQLLLGDYLHIPHEPPVMSQVITITVE